MARARTGPELFNNPERLRRYIADNPREAGLKPGEFRYGEDQD
ncbi:MAG TPA: hypothetical protein VG125_23790 [Pirellulales bacterium]|nr:hypothetical protein [Pirellulales bacterium]